MDSCYSSTDKRLDALENGNAGESKLHVLSSSSVKMASSSKVHWSSKDVETYCKFCIEPNEKGLPSNDTDGWTVITNKFEKLHKKYGRTQLISKLENLEEEWKR
ncbi:uncharacterized protein LOC125316597 [Rhodamnia argentea]|uniref:Uncharacterized protein LOC125316597 n=1 Tax=Rhodamnia argentea TaxID=178133 RepID=A0ABM3HXI8_9MYRT|nr:uncharacterized protein LOC125316597 [Rhodamnia argentea]